MVKNRYGWVVILLLFSLIAAACGGGSDSNSGATAVPENTVEPTSAFPPTWTPVPTLTSAPRATIEYTYAPPTEPPMSPFPTRSPSTPPPTLAPGATPATDGGQPAPNTLTLTAERLNQMLLSQFDILTSYLKGIPDIQFQDGLVRIEATVYTTAGDTNSARPIVIEAGVALENGIVRLSQQQAYFADDNTPYEDALAGYLLGTVETGLNDLVRQLYLAQNPGGSYVLTDLTITPEGIVVTTAPSE